MASRIIPEAGSLPIPRNVAPGKGWTGEMCEMADCIGAYETLQVIEHFGGQRVYVPADPSRNPFRTLIGARAARAMSRTYGRETITVPTARYALAVARRAPLVAAARAGEIAVADLARALGVRREYASKLVNRTDEGDGVAPLRRGDRHDPRQMDLFG